MSGKPAFRLGELLLQAGAITRQQLSAALAQQSRAGGRLGTNLVEIGAVDERTLASVLSEQLRIPAATAAQLERATRVALELVPRELAEQHRAISVRIDGKRLWVALADPTDGRAISAIEKLTKLEVRPMVAPDILVDFALGRHYAVKPKQRIVEVRDSGLLEVAPIAEAPVYDPHGSVPAPKLEFLDQRKAGPPAVPEAARTASRPLIDGDALRGKLLDATTDDQIFDALLDALAPSAKRLALLLIRSAVLVGHRARGLDDRSLALVRVPLGEAPALTKMLEGAAPYLGPLPSQFGALFQEVGTPTGLCLPVTLGKRAVGVVVGGQVAPQLPAQAEVLARVSSMADLALHARHVRARLAKA